MKYYKPYRNERGKDIFPDNRVIYGSQLITSMDVTGRWDSNYGVLVFLQEGNNVTGYYPFENGLIAGVMEGNKLIAEWVQEPEVHLEKNSGVVEFVFRGNNFSGDWYFHDDPLVGVWFGRKLSELEEGNCFRYRLIHNAEDFPVIIANGYTLNYQEDSPYFYPETCVDVLDLLIESENEVIFNYEIPVQPGYSYTITVSNPEEEIEIDVETDNIIIDETDIDNET